MFINPEEYITVADARVMGEFIRVTPGRDTQFRDHLDERLPGVVRQGLALAVRAAAPHYTARLKQTQRMIRDIQVAARKGGKSRGDPELLFHAV